LIPLIAPNLHVILIHFPLALLGIGLFIEVFNFLWHDSSLHKAGRWMILIGTLLLPAVATSGIYALYDVSSHGMGFDSFSQLQSGSGFIDRDWQLVRQHVLLTGTAAGICLIAVCWYLGASDRTRRFIYFPVLTMLLIAMGLLTVGAWYAGDMVFCQGFGVVGKFESANEAQPPPNMNLQQQYEFSISTMQVHLVLAGFVFAVAAAGLGVAYRRSGQKPPPTLLQKSLRDVVNDPWSQVPSSSELVMPDDPALPSPRFWFTAAFLALLTLAAGLYVGGFIILPKVLDWSHLRDALANLATAGQRRIGLHIILGGGILILCLILAALGVWAPRQRELLGLSALLLILAVGAQIWIGTLLLFDTETGPIDHFRPPPAAQQEIPPPPPPTLPSTQPTTQTAGIN
jgi:uncharacterized membrane protein